VDVALFGLGNFCEVALATAELLQAQGIKAAVINPRWIKPLDHGTLEFFARSVKLLCTLEDHALSGGFGAAVAEHLSDAGITTPLLRVGWPDQFIEHGSVAILREKYGMTAQAAAERILVALNQGEKNPSSLPLLA
jgi:1-deoxy-D-xylulose-5-phosphate synthase